MAIANKSTLLYKLVARGDQIDIDNGRLEIKAHSKKDVPQRWIKDNYEELVSDVAQLFSIDVYIFDRYSTGEYGKHKSQGLSLQFINIETGEEAYTVFNVELKRLRNTNTGKAGASLPKGQFRVTKNMKFYKWWKSINLKLPPRLSSFHSYMGNIKELLFFATPDNTGKITDKMTPVLNIPYASIKESLGLLEIDNSQTTRIQLIDNTHTTIADKESNKRFGISGFQEFSSACEENYGKRSNGNEELKGVFSSVIKVITTEKDANNKMVINNNVNAKKVQEQSTDDWLSDYDKA